MLRVKNKQKDLQRAAKTLTRAVSRKVKLKTPSNVDYECTVWRRRHFISYKFKGDALKLREALTRHGFICEQKVVAEEVRVTLTKAFVHDGQEFIARLVFLPNFGKMTLSVSVAPVAL